MSLQTDAIFIRAISENNGIASVVNGRIYSTAIPLPDNDADNVPVPYIIVMFNGLQNDADTKDSSFEGDEDKVEIAIEICAETRGRLAELAELIRTTVRQFFENLPDSDKDYDLIPMDYTFSCDAVVYDVLKPCFWQVLRYQCDTKL